MNHGSTAPELSIVIPIHDEQTILQSALDDLRQRLAQQGWSYEVVLAENGSCDQTPRLAQQLCELWPELRLLRYPQANYGVALRSGILAASGRYVICEEIDLCDVSFHARALSLLRADSADLVVGSKLMRGSRDARPLPRHLVSLGYSALLRVAFDFAGTDTHGLKAFRRTALLPIVMACAVDGDVFASELVIRAERAGVRWCEIPVATLEKRPPSIQLARRVPRVAKNLLRLARSLADTERK